MTIGRRFTKPADRGILLLGMIRCLFHSLGVICRACCGDTCVVPGPSPSLAVMLKPPEASSVFRMLALVWIRLAERRGDVSARTSRFAASERQPQALRRARLEEPGLRPADNVAAHRLGLEARRPYDTAEEYRRADRVSPLWSTLGDYQFHSCEDMVRVAWLARG